MRRLTQLDPWLPVDTTVQPYGGYWRGGSTAAAVDLNDTVLLEQYATAITPLPVRQKEWGASCRNGYNRSWQTSYIQHVFQPFGPCCREPGILFMLPNTRFWATSVCSVPVPFGHTCLVPAPLARCLRSTVRRLRDHPAAMPKVKIACAVNARCATPPINLNCVLVSQASRIVSGRDGNALAGSSRLAALGVSALPCAMAFVKIVMRYVLMPIDYNLHYVQQAVLWPWSPPRQVGWTGARNVFLQTTPSRHADGRSCS